MLDGAAVREQEAGLGDGFHAFGDDGEAELPSEFDNRGGDRRIASAFGEIDDEGAVDFQLVDRKAFEITQRRKAGAEVVELQAEAHLMQPMQPGEYVFDIVHQQRLGQFQRQQLRFDSGAADRVFEFDDQAILGKAGTGEVDR